MIPGFHGVDLIAILAVALLIFGPKRLPEMGSAIGKSIKEFRKGMNELTASKEEPKAPAALNLDAIERENASRRVVIETPVEASNGSNLSNVETPIE